MKHKDINLFLGIATAALFIYLLKKKAEEKILKIDNPRIDIKLPVPNYDIPQTIITGGSNFDPTRVIQ